jgi:His-Xaa-Ser system protein HxsD
LSDANSTAGESFTDELSFQLDDRRVIFVVDEDIYPRDAVYGAAYLFVDRCFVFLARPADQRIEVRLKARDAADAAALERLAGEFANELLNQVLRWRVGESTAKLREYTLARAFFTEESRSSIDQLLAELDAEELADDPLEIQVPWDSASPAPAAAPAGVPDGGPAGEGA